MKKYITSLAITAALAAGSAQANTVYSVTSAIGSGNDHSFWIQGGIGGGIGSDFDFSPAGTLTLLDDGTATLVGTVISQNDANSGFVLSFNYDNDFTFNPVFKSENGSTQMADTIFRDLEGGSLTGFGVLEGLDLFVSRNPNPLPGTDGFATQIGTDANNKNDNFGMANWVFLSVDSASCSICNTIDVNSLDGRQGDINVDLAPVPLPAAALLFLSGLGGLIGFQRRKMS